MICERDESLEKACSSQRELLDMVSLGTNTTTGPHGPFDLIISNAFVGQKLVDLGICAA